MTTPADYSAFVLNYARTLILLEEAGIRVRSSQVDLAPYSEPSADIHLYEADLAKVLRVTGVETAYQYERYATFRWRGATLYTADTPAPKAVVVTAAALGVTAA